MKSKQGKTKTGLGSVVKNKPGRNENTDYIMRSSQTSHSLCEPGPEANDEDDDKETQCVFSWRYF